MPHTIPRTAIDSGVIKAVGWQDDVLVIEFHNGSLRAYKDVPLSAWESFGAAESRGRFYSQEIKGKYSSELLTGQCVGCGARHQVIAESCGQCGGVVRLVDRRHDE